VRINVPTRDTTHTQTHAHNTTPDRRIGVFKYNTHENNWDEKCGGTLTFDKGRLAVQVSAYMHVCA
jgi:hypothetical protein